METTTGPLGFTIPIQTLSESQEVKLTPADVTAWRNRLPMADLGSASKKIYHAISDCNKVSLGLKERFEILELFRPIVQFVCQSLSKHYIHQTASLSKQQLTIANLAQTLQAEMANGYKLLVEQLPNEGLDGLRTAILPTILLRIVHYFTHILLRNYHLYYSAPSHIWKELYLVYNLAEKNQFFNQNNLIEEYKRSLLLAATFPYQWRQSEQEAIYKATEAWANLATIRDDLPIISEPGFVIIDFTADTPPISPSRGKIQFSNHCKVLDVSKILERIKTLLLNIEPNELKARIAHSNEPEYTIPTAVLRRLIKEWGTMVLRTSERQASSQLIKICIGLAATHYYLNGERPFQTQTASEETNSLSLSLPTLGIQEESFSSGLEHEKMTTEKTSLYPVHTCMIINTDSRGYGLRWQEDIYPSIQSGEVIGIQKTIEGKPYWEVGVVRWLQQQNGDFNLGVEKISSAARSASAQLIKEGQPSGYFLRCLMLESSVLTPILPFKTGSQVSVLQNDEQLSLEIDLTMLVDATGSYKRFEFTTKEDMEIKMPTDILTKETSILKTEGSDKKSSGDDSFDSIWSNL